MASKGKVAVAPAVSNGFLAGRRIKFFLLLLAGGLGYWLLAGPAISERDFVGKWQSSRLVTPLHLAANGEWEIKTEAGAILQYGVWRYADKKIIWTIKQGTQISDDVNPVVSLGPGEFRLQERDGTTTVFRRLE